MSQHESFHCEVQPERQAVRVRPVGEVDLATVGVVEAHLAELASAGFKQLTLDLRAVSFLDSTGLRMILQWDASTRHACRRARTKPCSDERRPDPGSCHRPACRARSP
jgi:anti-anti-sigma factor